MIWNNIRLQVSPDLAHLNDACVGARVCTATTYSLQKVLQAKYCVCTLDCML